ncbi:nitrate reductase associated protein [Geminocystis sp. NIES-3708]|uniref:nitrate reductase associated protein n=1 Tax=Geminocystis sp. NIES-3708 TaxID=1615909 RepID=UPI0005FC5627|nr:nitrate reductase associated protein [Geminocystis sp. NIES-3708]BAQ62563.1 nitrate reductase associated protein [Geminocystis sp. NIES-3708]
MANFFEFETDFVDSLRCIPMIVRFKLDTCGVKLKLHHWHNFNQIERESLVHKPCLTPQEIEEYKQYTQNLVYLNTGEYAKQLDIDSHPEWLNLDNIPIDLEKKAKEFNLIITLSQWQNLTNLQRFVLIKLSRPSHENKNFLPALKEFNIYSNHE